MDVRANREKSRRQNGETGRCSCSSGVLEDRENGSHGSGDGEGIVRKARKQNARSTPTHVRAVNNIENRNGSNNSTTPAKLQPQHFLTFRTPASRTRRRSPTGYSRTNRRKQDNPILKRAATRLFAFAERRGCEMMRAAMHSMWVRIPFAPL